MMILTVITGWLNTLVLALTARQRWGAARGSAGDYESGHSFILICIIVMITLTALLLVVSFNRSRQQRKKTSQLFSEYAQKRGLSKRERNILFDIARKAGLRRFVSIFTTGKAFDRGASKIIEEKRADKQATEESKQLKTEVSFLREKLGFRKQQSGSTISPTNSKNLSSRQITVGRKVHMTRRKASHSDTLEATVDTNTDTELGVILTKAVKITFGEFWCVRYYFGASVWEFDTSVVSYDGTTLVLNHSDNVRFINRRRFLRVLVNKPAFIASFPFVRTPTGNWEPPKFVPAVVTELAGPGLRIEAEIEVKTGERILVVFGLDEENNKGSIQLRPGDKAAISKIIEDIGEVKHTKAVQNGLSIAVELTGLSELNIDELTRVTNAASIKAGTKNGDIPASVNAGEHVPESATAQGA